MTFNYQFEAVGDVQKRCLCGAGNCSGFIGKKPQSNGGNNGDGGSETVKNGVTGGKKKGGSRKVKKDKKDKGPRKEWEDLCFRCFDAGEVIMCDYKTCPKVYCTSCNINRLDVFINFYLL